MMGLGTQELIVIFIVALLVFGPKKLPELGRTLGKGLAELKRAMHDVKEQIDSEIQEIKKHNPVSFDNDIYKTEQNANYETTLTETSPVREKHSNGVGNRVDENKVSSEDPAGNGKA